jgi:hypothetical protein
MRLFKIGLLTLIVLAGAVNPHDAKAFAGPPITVVSCRAENFGGGYGGAVADVLIKFTNSYSAAATSVRFSVNYQGHHAYIVAKGSYAPNVTVTERFHQFVDQPYMGKTMNACVAIKAIFADGSTWSM